MLTLANVLEGLTGSSPDAAKQFEISKVTADSRTALPGSVFVALPGERVDGHNFVAAAFEAGAIAAIIERDLDIDYPVIDISQTDLPADWQPPICIKTPNTLTALQDMARYWRNQFSPQVIGITGSVGKTSTKELTYMVLSQRYKTFKNEGNLNSEVGLPLTLLELDNTHQMAVLEMGMYNTGEIKMLCEIARPQVGVITNIGPSHLERLGTMDKIVAAKQELVESLDEHGIAILNADDSLVMSMRSHTRAQIFTYGLSNEADLWADEITGAGLEGIRFVLHYRGETMHVKVPLLGRHSVHTALRAAAVGLTQGLGWDEIIAGLQNRKAQLRLVAVPGPNGSIILDDTYNASPASTIAALNLLRELNAKRKIAVLGYMAELGAYEEEGHKKVGCRAADVADQLIIVGQKSNLIASEAIACGMNTNSVHIIAETAQALEYLQSIASKDDIILVKGSRSQAMESIVAGLSVSADI